VSGIVGIFNLDGAPIDRILLARLTNTLRFRGPDAQRIWFRGPIGLGHTLLQSSTEFRDEHQPLSLDGNCWMVSDARVDGRSELIAALQSHGRQPLDEASDAELILRAYKVWGEDCVEHLLGDFAFAIWDAQHRRLFCARDQMGVKPFFYARLGSLLVFGNTLDCLRQHPAVSDRLDDLSMADFLLFDLMQDPAATAFADIRRLPAAHVLLCEQQDLSIRRYWTPSAAAGVHYRRPADYVERFQELLDTAVADRLRSESACIFMSGGLDSPTVAAGATRVSRRNGNSCALWAYTQVFDSLIPHEERHYAGLVAQALKIPIEYRADDHLRLFQMARQADYHPPEPVHAAWPDVAADQLQRVSTVSRVVLTGFGADPLFSGRISVHLRELLRQRRLGRALADALRYCTVEGRLSRLYLRTRWRILFAPKEVSSGFFPAWLNEDFAKKLGLRDRWETFSGGRGMAPPDAVRPEAYECTFAPLWPSLFGAYDAGVTRVPVEVRHPFFDLRLMSYLLALPRLPWCCDKQLLREAARGVLPDAVRLRRKSPLLADPLLKLLEMPEAANVNCFEPQPELERYAIPSRIPQALDTKDSWAAWVNLKPLSLNYWLRGLHRSHTSEMGDLENHDLSPAGMNLQTH
jgi:asparagine synthase (glutamine-hydrolysing)